MRPLYRITANRRDITEQIQAAGLISLRVRDLHGFESDEVTLEVNDIGSKVVFPSQGAKLSVAMGYRESGLIPQGEYIVSSIRHSGAPDKLVITAKAADMLASLKVPRTRSWQGQTVGSLLTQIAAAHGLTPAIDSRLAGQVIAHLDQTESDMALLTRLGERYHATAKPAGGRLLFVRKGSSATVSGLGLPPVTIQRSSADSHEFQLEGRAEYSGVRASFGKVGKPQYVQVGAQEHPKTLMSLFATQAEAQAAAEGEWRRMQQGVATMSLTLAVGRPELFAGQPIQLQGWRKELQLTWIVEEVEHELEGNSGISSRLKLTTKQD